MGEHQELVEHRLDRIEQTLDKIDKKVSNINVIEHRVVGIEARVLSLEKKAEKKVEQFFGAIISAGVGGLITYLVTIILKK